jgi:hypothetical protein
VGDRRLYGYLFLLEVFSFPLIFRGCGVFSLNPGEHYRGKGAPPTSFKRSPQEFPLMIKNEDEQIFNLAISFSLADNI